MSPRVKICGLTEPERVADAVRLGANFVGLVFYPPSARAVRPDRAAELAAMASESVEVVGVFVDPDDALLATVLAEVPLDVVQLHGAETPERVRAVALSTGCRVMKAIRVETEEDLESVPAFADAADLLLFDAKPPRTPGAIPGGNGLAFDWRLLEGLSLPRPWALAGGLDASTLEAAVRLLAPPIVDVSSGVERRPGIKDPAKLEAFLTTAARLRAGPAAAEPLYP